MAGDPEMMLLLCGATPALGIAGRSFRCPASALPLEPVSVMLGACLWRVQGFEAEAKRLGQGLPLGSSPL